MGLLKKLEMNHASQPPSDHHRICGLNVIEAPPVVDLSDIEREGCPFELNLVQKQALSALRLYRGLFGPIGVGFGKSWIAALAGAAARAKRTIVLAPASTIPTLVEAFAELSNHYHTAETYFISYEKLSSKTPVPILTAYTMGLEDEEVLIVADEAHRLARLSSARTGRIMRFFKERPGVGFAAISGTMTGRCLSDFAHLAQLALGENCPVPTHKKWVDGWDHVLSVKTRPNARHWAFFEPLWNWAHPERPLDTVKGREKKRLAREAFQRRMRASAGVVASDASSLGVDLEFYGIGDGEIYVPLKIEEAIENLRETGITPGGEVVVDDLGLARVERQLVQGFYYIWDWPGGEPDDEWLDARSNWNRFVRAELAENRADGYDSPGLVADVIARESREGHCQPIHEAWQWWESVKARPEPPSKAIWVSPYLLDYAEQWAKEHQAAGKEVVIWYGSRAFGDELQKRGIRAYGGGDNPPEHAHTCAMSIDAHGIGKNLWAWDEALVTVFPAGGRKAEQLIGRHHRQGQKSSLVRFSVCVHHEVLAKAFASAATDGDYIQSMFGGTQKIHFGRWTGALQKKKKRRRA